jgi:hypothetical protein
MSIGCSCSGLYSGSPCEKTPIIVAADDNRLAEISSFAGGAAHRSVNQPHAGREGAVRSGAAGRRA